MRTFLDQLADFIEGQTAWITQRWSEALARQGDIPSAENLTHPQLSEHLPHLCADLGARLRQADQTRAPAEECHALAHGRTRWQQGYKLDEIIRETGLLRQVIALDCLDQFARQTPGPEEGRRQAEILIDQFFTDTLADSARQLAGEGEKALAASKQNSQAILDSALDSIIVIDETGRVREWNPAAEKMFGYRRAHAVGEELANLIIPAALRARHREGLARYHSTGTGPLLGRRIDMPALHADGSELTVELAITPYKVEGRALFTAYLRDITARKAGEEASQRLAAVIQSSDDAIISKDLNGVIMSWNKGAEHLFGYRPEEIIGQHVTTLIPFDRQSEEPEILKLIRRGEHISHLETVRRRKDGTLFHVSLTVSPILDGDGVVVGASTVGRNITERVQNERRRAAQYAIATLTSGQAPLERTATQILETVGLSGPWVLGVMWLLNAEGNLICSARWRKPGRGPTPYELDLHTRVFSPGAGLIGEVFAAGKPSWIANLAFEPKFPRAAVAEASGLHGALLFPLLAPEGSNGVIEMVSDAVLAPDEDLLHLAEALGRQVGLYLQRKKTEEELRCQKEAAEAANQAKDRFLAALSHELRTPLNPVLMWACATVQEENLEPDLKDGLRMICRNVELEARLIDDLLDLTRINRGKLQLNLQPCRADELLRHALEIVRSQLGGRRLEVTVDLAAQNHVIQADPTRIQQVFWNVLKNAAKFTPERGEIIIRSFNAAPERVAFEISDSGGGLDPEVMPRLFTPFEQGAVRGEGLGLGLAICKAIVEMHGGKIIAANRTAAAGAVFTIEFETVSAPVAVAVPKTKSAAVAGRPLRILIVEDHEHTAMVMSKLLQRTGHDVLTASTVREAVEIVNTKPFDLLLSDVGLPDGSGFQVMNELSKISKAKGIAVSGYGMEEDIARSSRAGFSAHLTKPINVQELQETIQLVTSE